MTFTQIVDRVAKRLNLTSTDATNRIGEEVNDIFREVVSGMGLETSIRSTLSTTSATDSPYVTFGGDADDDEHVIKVLAVYLPQDTYPPPLGVLMAATFDELRNRVAQTWPPRNYAIANQTARSVTLFLDAVGANGTDTIYADVLLASDTLSGTDQPGFPENFHDIIVNGVLALEYDKMEKESLSEKHEAKFEKRKSELRMFLAKDAYLSIYQGKTSRR